jgi:hypothetical protein
MESAADRYCARMAPLVICWPTGHPIEAVADVPAVMTGAWLRDELNINPIAVGPVEGGPAAVRPIVGSRNQA